MSKAAMPSVFPPEGRYEYSGVHIDLACMTQGAEIYFSIDGSDPRDGGIKYIREQGLILLPAEKEKEIEYCVRAIAVKEGMEDSDEAQFHYQIAGRKRGEYRHILMRELTEKHPGIIRIEDFDRDKMYLLVGSSKAVLVDAGWDEQGDLPDLCRQLIGDDKPLELVVAHGHPDHIAQLPNFLSAGCKCFMPYADIDTAKGFAPDIDYDRVEDIKEGDILDIGNAVYKVYTIPGHTPGSVVLLDEENGDLFSSDGFGSNRRYVPDSAWLQLGETSAEAAYDRIEEFCIQIGDKAKRIFTGHNEEIYEAVPYLKCLKKALKKAVSDGDAGLSPSLRSVAESFGSGSALIEGDWRYDPLWISVNIRYLTEKDRLSVPPVEAMGFEADKAISLSGL
ncbi:MAG: MBL fold metallo-hydrolase [Eubacteriales bacterium]|nr:MBL fold metallo-hydrolase [Eubacteriales bacterium]